MTRIVFTLIALLSFNYSFSQKPIDLSIFQDKISLGDFYKSVKAKETGFAASCYYIIYDSAIWNGIKMKDVVIYENKLDLNIDKSIDYSSQKLIEVIESKYKDDVIKDVGYSSTTYTVNNSSFYLELYVDLDKDDSIAKDTPSKLKITYKTQYKQPYARIENEVPKNTSGKFYYIKFQSGNVCADFFINGIKAYKYCGDREYTSDKQINLNPYILTNGTVRLNIIIKPGYDENGVQTPVIIKKSNFSATLCEGILKQGDIECLQELPICNYEAYVTDTTINEDGDESHSTYMGNPNYGTETLEDNLDFTADVSYNIPGWKDGNDLRKDPNINQKITALYEQLAKIIQTKNEKALNDFMYQKGYEESVSGYNSFAESRDTWEKWMNMLEYAYKFKIEKDFRLEFSEDGKLVYATPNNQVHMLRVVGKQQAEGFTFFMYEDKKTKELKVIR